MTSDQLRLPLARPHWTLRFSSGSSAVLVGVAAAAALGAGTVLHPELWRGLLAAAFLINVFALGVKWPRAAAVATLLWLPFLAFLRRILIGDAGWETNDPLLLVGPIAALFLCYRIFVLEKRQVAPDRLSKLVLLLLVLAFLCAFNPLGAGGVFGGLAGLLYLGVPLLWFFIGRELGDRRTVRRLMYAVVFLACVIAVYGLYQTQFGSFPQWDIDWYHITGYKSLGVGRTAGGAIQLRPWGTFSSNSEYSAYLGIAIVFAVAFLYHRRPALAVAIPLLMVGVLLAGGRSVMALTLLSGVVLTALRTRNKVFAGAVVVLGIGVTYVAAVTLGDRVDRAANLSGDPTAKRQASGLLNPLDSQDSTFLIHLAALQDGVESGFTHPVGQGTGASNNGANVGGSKTGSVDNDVGNVFLSLGLVGGILFVVIIVLSFRTVFTRYVRGPPDPLVLAVAGMMVLTLGYWLNGGHYATSALLWFMLGWAVRTSPSGEGDLASPAELAPPR